MCGTFFFLFKFSDCSCQKLIFKSIEPLKIWYQQIIDTQKVKIIILFFKLINV